MLVDTHCHIHSADYRDAEAAYARALDAGVEKMICVGTDVADSKLAVKWAESHEASFVAVGVHPHETKHGIEGLADLLPLQKVVAMGEIGLDYYYNHSEKQIQGDALEQQIQLALDYNLPIIFHVREAFDDFWPIFNNFTGIRGVLHSYTDTVKNVEVALGKGLYIGVNGISTFTKNTDQQAMFSVIPLNRLLLETDAPYLTPSPKRGKVNEPAYVRLVANYLSKTQSTSLESLSQATTYNATHLFNL